ncbi:MAG: hypothetical protein ACM4D3_10870 [Candidatus Sericytochromatia bacterium]
MKVLFFMFGAALLALGVAVGTHRLTVSDNGMTESCGIAYQPQSADAATANGPDISGSTDLGSRCDSIGAAWQASAMGLTAVGVVMMLGGLFIRTNRAS